MTTISSLQEAEQILAGYEQPPSVVAYTLETMQRLMHALGDPQDKLHVVHVAGTSGKTSTSYYAAALLKQAGYRVGLSVSPHLYHVSERTQVDGRELDEEVYCRYLSDYMDIVESTGLQPSYFELLVGFSYWVFAEKERVNAAVIEVGLGGLLDATNVIHRQDKICIITDIGYDHMNVLGDTIEQIAAQKAGIIQPGNHVFIHSQSTEIMQVITDRAAEQGAFLYVVGETTYDALPLFQQRNLSLSVAAVRALCDRDGTSLTDQMIADASRITVPGRMQVRQVNDKTVILDGSHNDQKIGALVDSLEREFPPQPIVAVVAFGAQRRQNAVEGLRLLRRITDTVVVTEFSSHQDSRQQSLDAVEVAELARQAGFLHVYQETVPNDALKRALSVAPLVVVTGSFYLLKHLSVDIAM